MATIIKRKKAYSVVYNYVDENGETKQKWETVHTHKEALRRKAEVENTQNAGTFLPQTSRLFGNFCMTLLLPMAKESGASRCMTDSFP